MFTMKIKENNISERISTYASDSIYTTDSFSLRRTLLYSSMALNLNRQTVGAMVPRNQTKEYIFLIVNIF
jgi:hypothetical protein